MMPCAAVQPNPTQPTAPPPTDRSSPPPISHCPGSHIPSHSLTQDEVDSAGRLLWQLDDDGDPLTPDRCAGIAYGTGYVHSYTPYSYDGIVAFAQAATAVAAGGGSYTGPALAEALYLNTSFEGVTGQVEFTNRDDNKGDREVGVAYTVVNHDGTDYGTLTSVGTWTVDTGLVLSDAGYTYLWPTVDGLKPDDTVNAEACPKGSYGQGGASCYTWYVRVGTTIWDPTMYSTEPPLPLRTHPQGDPAQHHLLSTNPRQPPPTFADPRQPPLTPTNPRQTR